MKTDKQMIQDPDKWPQWPWLPVKRPPDSFIDNKRAGILCCSEEHIAGKMVIFHAYLWKLPDSMERVPKTEYASVDAMLADGWEVD